jgi:plastocyanin
MSADDSVSRRGFLRGATGAAAAAGVAGAASGTAAAQSSEEVIVGPGGELVYEPAELFITPGTTVNFAWESDNHNIVVDSQPEGAGWEGTEGGAGDLYNEGHEYSYTFETMGTHEYYCAPHLTSGMVGAITVNESGEDPDAGGGSGGSSGPPPVPDSAKTLGVATIVGMLSTLGLAYFFMRYGGDYEVDE